MADRSDLIKQMRDMGYGILTEGYSLASIHSFVIYEKDIKYYRKHPFILYGCSPFRTGKIMQPFQLDLFKLMSYQVFPHDRSVAWEDVPKDAKMRKIQYGTKDINECNRIAIDHKKEIKHRNNCYNTVSDKLGKVIGILEIDGGTQWICENGNALFIWEESELKISSKAEMRITQLITPEGSKDISQESVVQKDWTIKVPKQSVLLFENVGPKIATDLDNEQNVLKQIPTKKAPGTAPDGATAKPSPEAATKTVPGMGPGITTELGND